jgi:hypothetical protein
MAHAATAGAFGIHDRLRQGYGESAGASAEAEEHDDTKNTTQ